MDGSHSVQEEMRNADRILISKRKVSYIEGRGTRTEDTIKMDFKGINVRCGLV
jgi:hypothetical protein